MDELDYEICEKLLGRIASGKYTRHVYLFLDPIESVMQIYPHYTDVIERPYVRSRRLLLSFQCYIPFI